MIFAASLAKPNLYKNSFLFLQRQNKQFISIKTNL